MREIALTQVTTDNPSRPWMPPNRRYYGVMERGRENGIDASLTVTEAERAHFSGLRAVPHRNALRGDVLHTLVVHQRNVFLHLAYDCLVQGIGFCVRNGPRQKKKDRKDHNAVTGEEMRFSHKRDSS